MIDGGLDLDGDGLPDWVASGCALHTPVPAWQGGVAWVFLGPLTASGLASAAATGIFGSTDNDELGSATVLLPDVDGDGLADLALGAPGADAPGTDAGAVRVVLGPVPAGGDVGTVAATTIAGAAAGDSFGVAIDGCDLDLDGYGDLLAGGWKSDDVGAETGAAWLFLGPLSGVSAASDAEAVLVGESAGDAAGRAVACAGDLDGNGEEDLAIGAADHYIGGSFYGVDAGAANGGAAYVLLSVPSGTTSLADADGRLLGQTYCQTAGAALAGVGDATGDGTDDLLVGADAALDPTAAQTGGAWLVAGRSW